MTQPFPPKYTLSGMVVARDPFSNKMTTSVFYKWLRSRRVFCVEGFIVMLDNLEDLVGGLLNMESYCPALRSIEIHVGGRNNNIDQVESNLSVFLSYCLNLQGVSVRMDDMDGYSECFTDTVLSVLVEKLRENSLVKISLPGYFADDELDELVANLLVKHASSLQCLNLSRADGMELIKEHQIRLRVLSVEMGRKFPKLILNLMSYLSSAGGLLEDLKVEYSVMDFYDVDDLVLSVSKSCPKLTRFYARGQCSAKDLRQLFEQCPDLRYVSIGLTMQTDENKGFLRVEVKGSDDDWAISLSHILKRGQYKSVVLRLNQDYYHPVGNLKSMLEPYEIHLEATTSETALISLLQDLPRLTTLQLNQIINNEHTDATLSGSTEHANSLANLLPDYDNQYGRSISDELLGELIKHCPSLKRLSVSGYGLEIIMAVSKYSNVTDMKFVTNEKVSEEMLDRLLLDKKMKWPTTLEYGYLHSGGTGLFYMFNSVNHWTKSD